MLGHGFFPRGEFFRRQIKASVAEASSLGVKPRFLTRQVCQTLDHGFYHRGDFFRHQTPFHILKPGQGKEKARTNKYVHVPGDFFRSCNYIHLKVVMFCLRSKDSRYTLERLKTRLQQVLSKYRQVQTYRVWSVVIAHIFLIDSPVSYTLGSRFKI